jgi:DNA invertase Pin-like site-specific DNA recombinase
MKYIAYRRVSTAKQGQSGLGLEAQDSAIRAHVGGGEILAVYTEVESGKRVNRPELIKALAHARRAKAVLVIARLDRLARNVAFTANLMEAGVDFVCCDNPTANRLTIHILAAVAEDEQRRISARTKAALAAAKARGTLLGAARPGATQLSLEASRKGAEASVAARRKQAQSAYTDLLPMIRQLKAEGLSLQRIADRLTDAGHRLRSGKAWNAVQVMRVLAA